MHESCREARHPCFGCKMKLWRSSGHNPFASQSEEFFKGQTQREMVREMTDHAKATGQEIAPVHSRWV